MGPKQQSKKKGKAKAPAGPPADEEEGVIDLEPAPKRGGGVPPMVKKTCRGGAVQKAKGLVETWQLHGSQAAWGVACPLEMGKKKGLLKLWMCIYPV